MSTSLHLPTTTAVMVTLLAAFLWGSWLISLKHLGNYPIDGFYVAMFTFALVMVWGIGLVLDRVALIGNIMQVYDIFPDKIWLILACGVLYVLGMRLTLHVFATIGLSLSQPILSSVNVMVGTLVSAILGGTPTGFSVPLMVGACLVLLTAIMASLLAGNLRARAQEANKTHSNLHFSMNDMWRSLALLALASTLMPAYTMAISYGLRSITQPDGLEVFPFMAILSCGTFLGAMLGSGFILTHHRRWKLVFTAPFKYHGFGIFSGIFHFGGNILHAFGTASLSAVISWPLGITYTLWILIWGIVYGEFKGAPKRSYLLLGLAVLLYLIGAYLVFIQA